MSRWKKNITEVDLDVIYFEFEKSDSGVREVFVWDYDKTYIESNPETFRGFIKAAIEPVSKKQTVAGVKDKLNKVISDWREHNPNLDFPLYFVTASPPQAVEKIHQKIKLDGFNPLGIYCKNNLRNFKPKRWEMIYNHIGYKLQSFLKIAVMYKGQARLSLWGDNSEHDYLVFSLFSDCTSGRLSLEDLKSQLLSHNVNPRQIEKIASLRSQLPADNDLLKAAYIRKVKPNRVLPEKENFYFHN